MVGSEVVSFGMSGTKMGDIRGLAQIGGEAGGTGDLSSGVIIRLRVAGRRDVGTPGRSRERA